MTEEELLAYEIEVRQNYDNITDEGWKIVVEALHKQIPKKPISKYCANDGLKVCPSCETDTSRRILFGWEKHCPDCGQAIDWTIDWNEND